MPRGLCVPFASGGLLRSYVTLSALSLDELAREYLESAAADHPDSAPVFLALADLRLREKDTSGALFAARKAVPDYTDYDFAALPKSLWDTLYPRNYWSLVERQARASRLDPYVVMGLIRQESAFDPRAHSGSNALGLMQLLPQTLGSNHRKAVTSRRHSRRRARAGPRVNSSILYRPAFNIRAGCQYLGRLVQLFHGNLPEALAAYNAGDTRVHAWLEGGGFREPAEFVETIPFEDTHAYVEEVLRDAAIYRQLLAGTARFKHCPEN